MLALIAGQGKLPDTIDCAVDTPPLIAALEGFPPDVLTPAINFRIEQLGSFLTDLGQRGVTDVVFAGSLRRPPLDPSAVDAATMPLVPRMMQALQDGDDAALRIVLSFFEEAGFKVLSAHELVPELLPEAGVLTKVTPDNHANQDAERGANVVAAMGQADVGQACVVRNGQALVLEGAFGTEWMLNSLAQRPDGKGGVLYKAPKPDQDRRIDMPAIGPETVVQAERAGLDGIVVEADGVLLLEKDALIAAADAAGLFLWVRQP